MATKQTIDVALKTAKDIIRPKKFGGGSLVPTYLEAGNNYNSQLLNKVGKGVDEQQMSGAGENVVGDVTGQSSLAKAAATAAAQSIAQSGAGDGGGGGDGTAGGLGDTAGGGGYGSESGNADSAGGSPAGDGGGPMASGGMASGKTTKSVKPHVGPIHSPVAGRTDHLPMHVKSGSYVIPADIISAMGEGNTMAGFKNAKMLFGGRPFKSAGEMKTAGGPYDGELPKAKGGPVVDGELVPIIAAGGEYVIPPESVAIVGNGNVDHGHKVLDHFVKKMRAKTISTLKKLPGPKKD